MKRFPCGRLAALMLALCCTTLPAAASGKPVRLIVPLSPGSTVDAVARVMSAELGKAMGHPIVVENFAGAGGVPGTGQIVRAPKDGSVLGMISSNHVINPSIYKKIPFDAIKDITPITILGSVPLVLVVHPSLPVKDVRQLIALAKAKPDSLNIGSAGNGSTLHLAAELLAKEAGGLRFRHIPYKGTGPMTIDLLGNQIQAAFVSVTVAAPLVKKGQLRALGVSTATRSTHMPDVPALAEQGLPDYQFDTWIALVGPAGFTHEQVDKLYKETRQALDAREVRAALDAQGIIVIGNSPEQAAQFFQSELVKHATLVKQSGASLD